MSPTAFTEALAQIGWTKRHLAGLLQCDTNLPTRWERGSAPVPPVIALWLMRLDAAHVRNPVPVEWRSRAITARRRGC